MTPLSTHPDHSQDQAPESLRPEDLEPAPPVVQPVPEDGRRLRARARRQATHHALVSAAATVFGEYGFLAATMDQICAEAGVTRGTFYEHFASKAEVFGAVLDDLVSRLTRAVIGVDLEPDAPPPEIQLTGNLLRVLDVLLADPAVARLLLLEAGQEPQVHGQVRALHDFVRGMIRQALWDGRAVGLVRHLDAEVASHALLGAILAVMAARLESASPLRTLSHTVLARELLATCLCGVADESLRAAVAGIRPPA